MPLPRAGRARLRLATDPPTERLLGLPGAHRRHLASEPAAPAGGEEVHGVRGVWEVPASELRGVHRKAHREQGQRLGGHLAAGHGPLARLQRHERGRRLHQPLRAGPRGSHGFRRGAAFPDAGGRGVGGDGEVRGRRQRRERRQVGGGRGPETHRLRPRLRRRARQDPERRDAPGRLRRRGRPGPRGLAGTARGPRGRGRRCGLPAHGGA
mmetsp:Transcript_117321/g.328391  ORF Transcript_117321/g.328391 Transcript_117321/m.328391 type:complete len:210 (-) Transcript_117321:3-632(-)